MSHPLRKIVQGITYHVYSRCRGKQNLLKSKHGKKFVPLIEKYALFHSLDVTHLFSVKDKEFYSDSAFNPN